ncbi:NTP pyrophosphohydrolase [Rhodococcus sp. 15-725-2-2b]|uniref:NUDIX domain-containing protein n=1 Tax=unclassified Rhodococcus (in: high G+C Gram-positive bacteria) TaxID=192944 RepID=UPI000B9BBB27|nr:MULTISPECIES: NUDIX domain-containing protein [unclassified Rhodococcus (in: high G+C Gram-positive bacteria)]OZC64796.1 NTP pyrophosphohydrolase [Rhodococcus sp. 06-469-3-2]OZD46703.1 NTP pyrophosphohydrolase [Rhodococcus sp. 06-1477-1A]OZE71292.1 NTP pyrophosphohydrolase [Rhodococcus sp. 15-725-2-2b]
MVDTSAGILLYRVGVDGPDVLIAHPGGPFWARKDDGAWSIVKGLITDGENPWTAAQREFREEVGIDVPAGDHIELGTVTQRGGKIVTAFGVECDLDVSNAVSNTFEIEWPPKSGIMTSFPEVDRVEWFPLAQARAKLLASQHPFLDALEAVVAAR